MNLNGLFRIEPIGRTVVVTPLRNLTELGSDELLDSDAGGAIGLLESRQTKNVIIDCENMDGCCSSGVALFVTLWKRSQANGGRMAFCNVSAHLRQIVETLHLGAMWPVFGSLTEALEHVEK